MRHAEKRLLNKKKTCVTFFLWGVGGVVGGGGN